MTLTNALEYYQHCSEAHAWHEPSLYRSLIVSLLRADFGEVVANQVMRKLLHDAETFRHSEHPGHLHYPEKLALIHLLYSLHTLSKDA